MTYLRINRKTIYVNLGPDVQATNGNQQITKRSIYVAAWIQFNAISIQLTFDNLNYQKCHKYYQWKVQTRWAPVHYLALHHTVVTGIELEKLGLTLSFTK